VKVSQLVEAEKCDNSIIMIIVIIICATSASWATSLEWLWF
jgi:hypothetical protein